MSNRCVLCSGFSIYYNGGNTFLKVHRKCLLKILENSKYASKVKRNVVFKKPVGRKNEKDILDGFKNIEIHAQ